MPPRKVQQNRFRDLDTDQSWEKQFAFYRTHLDIAIEEMFYPINLKDQQKIIARAIGNKSTIDIVQSRGAGKTWIVAMAAQAIAVLFPDTPIICISGTARQASLVLEKIEREQAQNMNLANELRSSPGGKLVNINKNGGDCEFKNGSTIRAMTINSLRGQRAKVIIVDESPEVNLAEDSKIFMPVRNYTRPTCITFDIPDFDSKIIKITSACLKSNPFYEDFLKVARRMGDRDPDAFAIALDYTFAIRTGITTAKFFEEERANLPQSQFDMEYDSIFIGAEQNSVFPYELTETCRTLKTVELTQPKDGQSKYVIAMDIATSAEKTADNAVLSVLKLFEQTDGSIGRQLVNLRSYHGKGLDFLSTEIRKYLVEFPNTVKVVYDKNGLGDSLHKFFDKPWVDPSSGKEYPPLVLDSESDMSSAYTRNAAPLLRAVVPTNQINQRLVSDLRVALEQGLIELPVQSRRIVDGKIVIIDDDASQIDSPRSNKGKMTMQEQAIYIETDALQIEMGNLVAKVSDSGSYVYKTARNSQRKDRFSSVALGNSFVSEMEIRSKKRKQKDSKVSIGVASSFY